MAEFRARDSEGARIPSGLISSADLGLHGRAEHNPHDAADDMNHTVVAGWGDRESVDKGRRLGEVV